ncbi:helix-turn-helix domain-containing protein [Corynebacterium provencense]|uniref:helix-turn-helix domain-containing protein n=1 Tax=Corynebacterium provencense TaxID=1737425 RepID=UPI0008361BA8|nr:helix-turn-helix domain-containing protein [Corynebacterium provencense]
MDTRITVHYDHRTRLWVCSPPGSWPTDWPTWHRAMDEANWHAQMLRDMHLVRPPWALRRRLRALQAQGYTPEWIAKKIQANVSDVTTWSTDPHSAIKSPTTSRRIVRLYDWVDEHTGGRIRDTGPTPEATANGWFPPAAWDDIDNPDENPAVTEGALQDLLKALVDRMGSQKQVADAVGISTGHLYNLLTGRYHESKKWERAFRDLWESLATQAAA